MDKIGPNRTEVDRGQMDRIGSNRTELGRMDQNRSNGPKCYIDVTQKECNNNKYYILAF